MTKNKHGNNKNGLGIMDLEYLKRYSPARYRITMLAIQWGYMRLAMKILDVK